MKLELIKETKAFTGDVYYWVRKDGLFVPGSLSYDYETTKNYYESCKKERVREDVIEILESEEEV
jgi:hypothetical protein